MKAAHPPSVLLATLCLLGLLSGCGGGGSSEGEGSTATATTAPAAAGQSGAENQKSSHQGGEGQGQGGSSQAAAPSASAKHGPRIATPKGPREHAPTPEQVTNATVADMLLRSDALVKAGTGVDRLPATYTCDGKSTWPELTWEGIPEGTAELVIYAMSVAPVQGKLFVDWAVAAINPGLDGLEAGKLPRGAIVGTNGYGKRAYSICPQGKAETYIFALFALPESLNLAPGFDARETRQQILDISHDVGLMAASYSR